MRAINYFALLMFLLFATAKSPAVVMTPIAVDEMTQQSDLVLHATVLSKVCERSPEGRIFTKVELEVLEVWKGVLTTNRFTVVHGGGVVGNLRTEVSGQVDYEVGEEVVAFIVINPQGEGVTLGLAQGKFHVWKDKASGEKFANNLFHGLKEQDAEKLDKKADKLALRELARTVKGGTK